MIFSKSCATPQPGEEKMRHRGKRWPAGGRSVRFRAGRIK
jgi:hypothetical protein